MLNLISGSNEASDIFMKRVDTETGFYFKTTTPRGSVNFSMTDNDFMKIWGSALLLAEGGKKGADKTLSPHLDNSGLKHIMDGPQMSKPRISSQQATRVNANDGRIGR